MSDDRDDPEPRRMIYEVRRRVQAARNQYWEQGVDASVNEQAHRELATAALQYHDVLYEFRDEAVVGDDDWPDVSPLRERVGKRVEVVEDSDVFGEGRTRRKIPAVRRVPIEDIVDITEQLDDLAKTLGFGATADSDVERDAFDQEDLAALIDTRDQPDAIEDTPADIRDRVEGADGD